MTTFPFNGHTTLMQAALTYIAEGFSVIPLHWLSGGRCTCGRDKCSSPAKHPISSLTPQGLKNASNDPLVIDQWWAKFPKANIGIVTGQRSGGLVVLDIDTRSGGDIALTSGNLRLPATLLIETGAGWHYWYRSSQTIKNSAGKLGQGIDIRGDGGYVVAPPSLHYSGRNYKFTNDGPIADFPEELLIKLTEANKQPVKASLPKTQTSPSGDSQYSNWDDLRAELGHRIESHKTAKRNSIGKIDCRGICHDGKGNKGLFFDPSNNQAHCNKGCDQTAILLAFGLPESPVFPTVVLDEPDIDLEIAIDQTETETEPEPDLELELGEDDREEGDSNEDNPADAIPDLPGKDPLIGAITTKQLRETVFDKPEMILQGLFKKDWGLMIGIGSAGKSTFLFNACISLACGRPFLPLVPDGQPARKVLYLDFEGSEWRCQEQLEKMCEILPDEEEDLVGENLHWGIEPEIKGAPWKLNEKPSLINLGKYVKQHNIEFIVIDTAAQATGLKDENSNGEVQRSIVVPVRRFAKHFNVGILLVHHEGRGKEQTKVHNTQYRSRGATALPDASRYIVSLIPSDQDKRGPVEVINSKNKGHGFDKVLMNLDEESRWFVPMNPTLYPPGPKTEDLIIEVLERENREMTLDEIVSLLPGASKGSIKNALTRMKREGSVIRSKHGAYAIPEEPED